MEFHRVIQQPKPVTELLTELMKNSMGRILIVDDEPALLKMMNAYLSRLGYAVTTSDSTDAAWKEVEAAPARFDLAVLDATMAGMTMEDLAKLLLRANLAIRVIAASGYAVDMAAVEAAAPGRVAFLLKPFSPEMLSATVRRMIGTQEEKL
jgi:two-component system cell cycle sensor histidine kinase/response regulator CckA